MNFHEPQIRHGGDGMDFYKIILNIIIIAVIVCVFITSIVEEIFTNRFKITIFHLSWIAIILLATSNELERRPYDYGLILFCIFLTVPIRILLNKIFHE